MTKSKTFFGLAVATMALAIAVPALAEDVKVGILGDLTGPIESSRRRSWQGRSSPLTA